PESDEEEGKELLSTSSEGSSSVSAKTMKCDVETRKSNIVDEIITDWRAINVISFISFITFMIQYTLNVSAFVYLLQIDRTARVFDQSWVKASHRAIIGATSALFAVHAYTTKTFRF
ncbi:hypothetical protein PENTCL1PPCAC_4897, partial [Pristionchus entomophagus]